jgi:hypothetical protein
MIDTCIFPTCSRTVDRDEFCFLHAKHFAYVKEAKKKKPIAQQSEKRKIDQRKYVKIVKDQVKKDDRCMIGSPVCTGKMSGFNHTQKRSPKNLLKKSNLVPCCTACNNFLEKNSKWALDKGHTVSRYIK